MAIRCPNCNCPRCKVGPSQEKRLRYRGIVRILQRRWRTCEHCGTGFWTREFVEDKDNGNNEKTVVNPLFHSDFVQESAAENPYIQGSET